MSNSPRRRLLVAGLIGAVGFELLKLLLGSYMQGVASKSMYGAFGVPIALLLWINFTAKLLLFCAAWTATPSKGEAGPASDAEADSVSDADGKADAKAGGSTLSGGKAGGSTLSGGDGGAPGPAAASAG